MVHIVIIVLLFLLGSVETVFSQTSLLSEPDIQSLDQQVMPVEQIIIPVIDSFNVIEVGKNIIFDASKTQPIQNSANFVYIWQFGDGERAEGIEVVHSYNKPGQYQVQLLVRDQDGNEALDIQDIFVYKKLLFFISDKASEKERIQTLIERSKLDEHIYIKLIESFNSVSEFLSEEVIIRQLEEAIADLERTDLILVWTNGSLGLTALSHFKRSNTGGKVDFSQKTIIFIYDAPLSPLENIAAGSYKTLRPRNIILTRSEAIWALLGADTVNDFISNLQKRIIDYRIVDESSLVLQPWNVISSLVNFMIDNGVPSNTIILILLLPIIATIVTFFRQVIGISTLGLYTPVIIALAFIALDIVFGVLVLGIVLFMAVLIRVVLGRYRLLYIPRIAIVFTMISVSLLAMFFFGAYFSIPGIISLSIFPLLMMSTLVEKFVEIQYDHGLKTAFIMMSQTVFVSVMCFYFVQWTLLQTFILGHPEFIIVVLLINIVLGRWTGLRLMEYIRFRHLLAHSKEE